MSRQLFLVDILLSVARKIQRIDAFNFYEDVVMERPSAWHDKEWIVLRYEEMEDKATNREFGSERPQLGD